MKLMSLFSIALAAGAAVGDGQTCAGHGFWNLSGGDDRPEGVIACENGRDCRKACDDWYATTSRNDDDYADSLKCSGTCSGYWFACGHYAANQHGPRSCEEESYCPDCGCPECRDVAHCGDWDEVEAGNYCNMNRVPVGYVTTEDACRAVCDRSGATCCQRYDRGDGWYFCMYSHDAEIQPYGSDEHDGTWDPSRVKAISCAAASEQGERVGGELPGGDAAPDMRGEPMIGGAFGTMAMEAMKAEESKTIEELEKNREELEKNREELEKNNAELEETVSALEEELAALRRAAAEEEEAKAPDSPAGRGGFATLNAIRALLRDDAAEGERGAVPSGEGGPP